MEPEEEFEKHLKKVEELAANVIAHAPKPTLATESFRADLAGFLAIAYAAAFEECIKELFKSFAKKNNAILHSVIEHHFEQINSRIKIEVITNDYLRPLGVKYRDKFISELETAEIKHIKTQKKSIKGSYKNIITWRHAFAHSLERQTTLTEVQSAYISAKNVIIILNKSLV